jgi:AI-2 transport protein TqsA
MRIGPKQTKSCKFAEPKTILFETINMKDLKTTNTLLLILVIPLVFYLMKTLNFILVPLIFSMFLALLFVPLVRWFEKKKVPKFVSIGVVIIIIVGVLKLGGELVKLSINEILSADGSFFALAEVKLLDLVVSVESFFGLERLEGDTVLKYYMAQFKVMENFGATLSFVTNSISMTLMTAFFTILLLFESINFQQLLQHFVFKQKYSSVKTFRKIEKDIIKFVKVKFAISLFTGIGFSIACYAFGVSFPIFWGLLAFLLNFIQMIGSVVSVILLSLFALVEMDSSGTLLFFILVIIGVQVLFGAVLEPIFMGKTFSLNVLTVLVMLMLWGFIWGIPGLIMAIPITVFVKIILEQFPQTKVIAKTMAGPEPKIPIPWKGKL